MRTVSITALFAAIFTFNGVRSLNILGVFPHLGKSHFYVFEPYLKELANRGHNLTVISHFPQKGHVHNFHDISLAGKAPILEDAFALSKSYWVFLQISMFLIDFGTDSCRTMLADKNVQNLWKTRAQFDLVVVEQFNSDCPLGLAYQLGAPVVGVTSHTLMPYHYNRFGIAYNPSYVPVQFFEGGTKPSLYQRVERTVAYFYLNGLYKYFGQRTEEGILRQYFDDVPLLEDLAKEIKFLLLYQHYSLTGSSLYPANVKEVNGFHVAKPKPLPDDLQKFIDESEHGVIYVSFGSMVRAASTPKEKLETMVAVFSKLPQRIIMKWEEKTLPGDPENIFLSKWLPQNDILAHPKVLAFYSHSGMLGTTEAFYHGKPVVAMPIFGDQPSNAAALEERGLGVIIQLSDLTEDNLLQKFKTVLEPKFREKVKRISQLWHDRPLSPMNSAIYWTEYAARNHNFTFRSAAADVPMFQYLCLDVIAVLLTFALVIAFLLKLTLSLLYRNSKSETDKRKSKKE